MSGLGDKFKASMRGSSMDDELHDATPEEKPEDTRPNMGNNLGKFLHAPRVKAKTVVEREEEQKRSSHENATRAGFIGSRG